MKIKRETDSVTQKMREWEWSNNIAKKKRKKPTITHNRDRTEEEAVENY